MCCSVIEYKRFSLSMYVDKFTFKNLSIPVYLVTLNIFVLQMQDIKFAVHAHPTLSEVLDELFKSAKVNYLQFTSILTLIKQIISCAWCVNICARFFNHQDRLKHKLLTQ